MRCACVIREAVAASRRGLLTAIPLHPVRILDSRPLSASLSRCLSLSAPSVIRLSRPCSPPEACRCRLPWCCCEPLVPVSNRRPYNSSLLQRAEPAAASPASACPSVRRASVCLSVRESQTEQKAPSLPPDTRFLLLLTAPSSSLVSLLPLPARHGIQNLVCQGIKGSQVGFRSMRSLACRHSLLPGVD